MSADRFSDKLNDYLDKIKDPKEDKCWFCNKTPGMIKSQFYKFMKNPPEELKDINVDDLAIMTYKTKKPICAGCFFAIKKNPDLIKEIFEKPEDEIWG